MTTYFEVTVAWIFANLVDLEDTKGKDHQEESIYCPRLNQIHNFCVNLD